MQPENNQGGAAYTINLDDMPKADIHGHQWLQFGTELICQSCPFKHASHIDVGYQLYGIDSAGLPMVRKFEVRN